MWILGQQAAGVLVARASLFALSAKGSNDLPAQRWGNSVTNGSLLPYQLMGFFVCVCVFFFFSGLIVVAVFFFFFFFSSSPFPLLPKLV